jgi:hypothetical protein
VSNRGGDVEAARRMRLEVSRIDLALIRWDVVIDLIKASIKNDSKEK